jgi:hypothetical protein
MEDWLMSSGGAEIATAVLSSFMSRPAVRPLLTRVNDLQDADAQAMQLMLQSAHDFLNMLKTHGNNFTEDENAIRVLLAALVPSGDITQMVSAFARILGMSRHRIMQGNKTQPVLSEDKCAGWKRVCRKTYCNKIDLTFVVKTTLRGRLCLAQIAMCGSTTRARYGTARTLMQRSSPLPSRILT